MHSDAVTYKMLTLNLDAVTQNVIQAIITHTHTQAYMHAFTHITSKISGVLPFYHGCI